MLLLSFQQNNTLADIVCIYYYFDICTLCDFEREEIKDYYERQKERVTGNFNSMELSCKRSHFRSDDSDI